MISDEFLDYVLDQLGGVPGLKHRRMFGGVGIYSGSVFFAIVDDDALYFKVSDANRQRYIDAGSEPFRPTLKQTIKTYFEVPAQVLESREKLADWANESIACAGRADKPATRSSRKRKTPSKQGRSKAR